MLLLTGLLSSVDPFSEMSAKPVHSHSALGERQRVLPGAHGDLVCRPRPKPRPRTGIGTGRDSEGPEYSCSVPGCFSSGLPFAACSAIIAMPRLDLPFPFPFSFPSPSPFAFPFHQNGFPYIAC